MRGAQPDAECPRCNHRQPPGAAIVTCLECGLAFPPKELQRSSKVRESREVEPSLPTLIKPPWLAIDDNGHAMTFRWPDKPLAGYLAIAAAGALALILLTSDASKNDKLFWSLVLFVIASSGAVKASLKTRITIDREQLRGSMGPILLGDISRIVVDGGRVTALTRYDRTFEIASASDPKIAAFVGHMLRQRLMLDD